MTRLAVWFVAWLQTTRGLWAMIALNTLPLAAVIFYPASVNTYTLAVSWEAIVLSLLILVGQAVEGKALHLKLDGLIEGVPGARNDLRGIERLPPAQLEAVISEKVIKDSE